MWLLCVKKIVEDPEALPSLLLKLMLMIVFSVKDLIELCLKKIVTLLGVGMLKSDRVMATSQLIVFLLLKLLIMLLKLIRETNVEVVIAEEVAVVAVIEMVVSVDLMAMVSLGRRVVCLTKP